MVTINSNSGQDIMTFSADNCKVTLYNLYVLEGRKDIGMSHRKLVCYRFHLLQIHIFFSMPCVRELVERQQEVKDEVMVDTVEINDEDKDNDFN